MKRMGFLLGEDGNIKTHVTEGIKYVTFYKEDHVIPIPYDCLVCFVGKNVKTQKTKDPGVAALEKLLIDIEEYKNQE